MLFFSFLAQHYLMNFFSIAYFTMILFKTSTILAKISKQQGKNQQAKYLSM